MDWIKQNRIRTVVGLAFFVVLFFIAKKNIHSNSTAVITNTSSLPIQERLSDEKLSPDKNLLVFVKSYPETDVADKYGVYGHILYDEIWIKNNNTGDERLLVKSGDISEYPFANTDNFNFSSISDLSSPIFSLDDKKVYFMSSAWTTSDAVFSVDVSTGKLNFVSDGNSLEVLSAGPYRGNLKVLKHKYYGPPDYGSYDHYYVITDSGKEIKDLGGISHINGEEIYDK